MAPKEEHRRKRVKVDQKKARKTATEPKTADIDIPALGETAPAKDTFLITAGTYERILYGIEARFVGKLLTLSPRFIFPAHIGCIKAVSAGGRFLASGSTDEIVKLYDLKKRVELGSLHEHKGSITSLQFHGHTHLLTASDDGAICIFRSKDWEPLKVLKAHKAAVTDIAIHPSGKLALSVSLDRSMILWNLLTGQKASRTRTPQAGELVEWSKSGTMYAIAYATEIQIYRVGQPDAVAMVTSRQ
ncbi:60s ribosome biogenesis protein mak11, partial [Linderina pennispora]